jgi:hypothetical protein
MSDLVWVLSAERGFSFGNFGISGSYILPKGEIDFEPKSISGKRLWVVLRGQEDRLLLFYKVKKVERIIDGYYCGDYWLSPEMLESIKLAPDYVGAARYVVASTRDFSFGVTQVSQESSDALLSVVKGSIQTKLLPPSKSLLKKIDLHLFPNNDHRLAQSALRAVVSHLTLEQIWANATGDRLGPFSNYACALLAEMTGVNPSPGVVRDLKVLDPISIIFSEINPTPESGALGFNYSVPCVDTEFSEIEPAKVYAREFISIDSKLRNIEEALKKTEHSEMIHQAMLKDISEYLIKNGIVPYESNSIDLFYRSNERLNVFEIKSASVDNILSQASKGAFQLACYLNELSKDYQNLSAKLVLQVIQNPDLQNYAVEALLRLGIEVLFYDPSKGWPNRIQGFPL